MLPAADQIKLMVTAKLTTGALPAAGPVLTTTGGIGDRCAACDLRIYPLDVECLCDVPFLPFLRFHVDCGVMG